MIKHTYFEELISCLLTKYTDCFIINRMADYNEKTNSFNNLNKEDLNNRIVELVKNKLNVKDSNINNNQIDQLCFNEQLTKKSHKRIDDIRIYMLFKLSLDHVINCFVHSEILSYDMVIYILNNLSISELEIIKCYKNIFCKTKDKSIKNMVVIFDEIIEDDNNSNPNTVKGDDDMPGEILIKLFYICIDYSKRNGLICDL